MSQSGQGTGDAGQTILVYNVTLDPWKKHPIRVSSKAHPTVLPLGIFSLLLVAFSCPARVPPLLSSQVLFGGVGGVPSQNLSLSFPFPCGSCSSCDLPGPSSTLSIPGWSSLSHCLIPGKGYLAGQGVGDRSQEESQCRKPPSPPGAHSSLQGSGPNASVIFRNLDF